jgi:hypothetical protein
MRTPTAVAGLMLFMVPLSMVPASSAGPFAGVAPGQANVAPPADGMLEAWRSFVDDIDAEARRRAAFPFDAEQRLDWYYTPVERTGMPIGALDDAQRERLQAFLRTGLGEEGTAQAFDIVALEEVLFATSGGRAMRDPGNYFLGVFGDPAPDGPWGWRFEGHHLSVSFTVVDGRVVSATPAFFGGNPAVVPGDAPVHAGLSPFAREQQAAHRAIGAFAGELLERALIADTAPDDILTSNARRAEMGTPEGVALGDMSDPQRQGVLELLGLFAARMDPDLADYQLAKINEAGVERVHFAWAGGTAPGERHYFRIHGPTFVVEWDNTQGNGNHVHSVWRDFADDFGYDPLGQHLAADHDLPVPGIDAQQGAAGGGADPVEGGAAAHRQAHASGSPHRHRDCGSTSVRC